MMNDTHPLRHVGPFKAYLVTVYTERMLPPVDILVLGCGSSRSAILTALRECSEDTRALGVRQVITFDNLIERDE